MNREIIVFSGLTIKQSTVKNYCNCLFFDPVKAGDIPSIVNTHKPKCIGIIDGFFHNTSAVLHKDILYALSKGVQVFGAGSIGALRAAELYPYGMIGIGKIYLDYKNEVVTGDDEVAVPSVYLPSLKSFIVPNNYDALINFRYTLQNAKDKGIIDDSFVAKCISFLKTKSFIDRNWQLIFDEKIGLDLSMLKSLQQNFEKVYINQKQLDSIELLKQLKQFTPQNHINNISFISGQIIWSNSIWSRPLSLTTTNDFLMQDIIDIYYLLDDTQEIYYKAMIYSAVKTIFKSEFKIQQTLNNLSFQIRLMEMPISEEELNELLCRESDILIDENIKNIDIGYVLTELIENQKILPNDKDIIIDNLRNNSFTSEFVSNHLFFDSLLRTVLIKLGNILGIKPLKSEIADIVEYINNTVISENSIPFAVFEHIAICENVAESLHKNMNNSIFKQMCYSNKYEEYYKLLKNINNPIDFNETTDLKDIIKINDNSMVFDSFFELYLEWIPKHRLMRSSIIAKKIRECC